MVATGPMLRRQRGQVATTTLSYGRDVCRERLTEWTAVTGGGQVACHLHTAGPRLAGAPIRSLSVSAQR